jgi:hypothetical protein
VRTSAMAMEIATVTAMIMMLMPTRVHRQQ